MKTETVVIQDRPMAMFSRGSDLFRLKVLRYVGSKDHYECFYMSDLQKRFKASRKKISNVMQQMVDQGIIIKIKSYPVFWKRKKE